MLTTCLQLVVPFGSRQITVDLGPNVGGGVEYVQISTLMIALLKVFPALW